MDPPTETFYLLSRRSTDDLRRVVAAIMSGYTNDPATIEAAARLSQNTTHPWALVPNHPGYVVSWRGDVRGPLGKILVQHRGRVRLGHNGPWHLVTDLATDAFRAADILVATKEALHVDYQAATR